jgi:hypothetical protein
MGLIGCGGGPPSQVAPLGPFQQSAAQSPLGQPSGSRLKTSDAATSLDVAALQTSLSPSWMLPEAKNEALLYIANYDTSIVRALPVIPVTVTDRVAFVDSCLRELAVTKLDYRSPEN